MSTASNAVTVVTNAEGKKVVYVVLGGSYRAAYDTCGVAKNVTAWASQKLSDAADALQGAQDSIRKAALSHKQKEVREYFFNKK